MTGWKPTRATGAKWKSSPVTDVVVVAGLIAMVLMAIWYQLGRPVHYDHALHRGGEAKATLGVIKDRIVKFAAENEGDAGGFRLWEHVTETELTGEYYEHDDYSIEFLWLNSIRLVAGGDPETGRPKVTITFDPATGKSEGGFEVTRH